MWGKRVKGIEPEQVKKEYQLFTYSVRTNTGTHTVAGHSWRVAPDGDLGIYYDERCVAVFARGTWLHLKEEEVK